MKYRKQVLVFALVLTCGCSAYLCQVIVKAYQERPYLPLKGICIVIDPGHGGQDSGARSTNMFESVINLEISKALNKQLKLLGAQTILTRTSDNDLSSKTAINHKKDDMKKRMDIINQDKVDCFLSIHLNTYPSSSVKGGIAFYERDNEVSKVFANLIQMRLNKLNDLNKVVKTGDYFILNNANKVGALIECGFMSNQGDKAKLDSKEYQAKLAKEISGAILEYFEIVT